MASADIYTTIKGFYRPPARASVLRGRTGRWARAALTWGPEEFDRLFAKHLSLP